MAFGMVIESSEMTAELYDSVMGHLDWDSQEFPPGLISHYACQMDDGGLYIFDVWESPDDFQRFAETRLGPAVDAASGGSPPSIEPTFFPLHREEHARLRV
jgi:heme-degrading monooxygenase HmoA